MINAIENGQLTTDLDCRGFNLLNIAAMFPVPANVDTSSGDTSGIVGLISGQNFIDVVFPAPQPNASWVFVNLQVINTVDSSPLNIGTGTVTSKTQNGFRVYLSQNPNSANYFLTWTIRPSSAIKVPATAYTLTGPSTGAVNAPKTFTVALPVGTFISTPVNVTPSDLGGGGTFSPSTVTLTTAAPSATFIYTPLTTGTKTLSVSNDGGLTDPTSITFVSTLYSTSYLLSGPGSGIQGSPSTNFTVRLPTGGSLAAPVTITPHDGGAGGTFTPTSVTLSTGTPSATFTYTPSTYGTRTITTTNSGSLTDPAGLTYVSITNTYLFSGPSAGSVSTPSTPFTVQLPAGGSVVGVVHVTPNDGLLGAPGVFTPASVPLSTASPSATFTYTPVSTGAKTLGVSNDGGLTNPANLTYSVT